MSERLGAETEALVAACRGGDKRALEALLRAVQPVVYGLAVRMLWHPEDARDATQEILIKVVTHLGGFEGRAAFSTWLYRIAVNALISFRRSRMEQTGWTFERFGADLDRGLDLAADETPAPDAAALVGEIKIGCTLGMLLCLDRDHRIAYILGEIMELDNAEAAAALEVAAATFRKRLSRARRRIEDFTRARCGIVDPANPCRCPRRLGVALAERRVDPARLNFAAAQTTPHDFTTVVAEVRRLDAARRAAALHRSNAGLHADRDIAGAILALLDTARAADKRH